MTNVVALADAKGENPAPNQSVIEALETMLREARDGQIQHLAAAYSDGASPPTDLYAGNGTPAAVSMLIGGMELCKHTMLMNQYNMGPSPF